MAYTETDLQRLEAALAKGERRVTFMDKTVEYRTVEELKAAIKEVKRGLLQQAQDSGLWPGTPRQIRITTHAKIEKAYENWQQGAVLINDMRSGFTFSNITFEEYRGQASDADGNVRRFIAAGEAHAFPMGTVDTFSTYVGPADFNETVNTLGQELYAKQEPRKFDRGTDLHTQSNPLPMCHRPSVLVKLKL